MVWYLKVWWTISQSQIEGIKMKQFIAYPHIEQFRNTCKSVEKKAQYKGLDDQGEPIVDRNAIRPTLKFVGTVKSHGTNATICFDGDDYWIQSRKNIITVEKDNAGFAFFVESNIEHFKAIASTVPNPNGDIIVLCGEWCGGNIQGNDGLALKELEKMFILYDVMLAKDNEVKTFLNHDELSKVEIFGDCNIYHIDGFEQWTMEIDFNKPLYYVPKLVELTEAVEEQCPIGRTFQVKGIGEGIVWKYDDGDGRLMFKTKGSKHSDSKVKKIQVSVTPEVLESIDKFVDYAVNINRLNQAYTEVLEGKEPEMKYTGGMIKWMMGDICREEIDTLKTNDLEPKQIQKAVAYKVKTWFSNRVEEG